MRRQLRSEEERLERLSSNLHLTKQQIDFFTQETQRALEGIKDANWRFTKEVCVEIGKMKSPGPALMEVCEKFLYVLDQQDRSWKTFRAICHNYGPLKALMNSVSADRFTEEQMNELLPIWKNQQSLLTKLAKASKGGSILAEWIGSCVEYKLRKETLTASLRKLPELERKIWFQLRTIAEKNAQILLQEEKILDAQTAREAHKDSEEESDRHEPIKSGNLSVVSITSTNPSIKLNVEDRIVGIAPLHQGTATGGLLSKISPRATVLKEKIDEFPNFGSGELYNETPMPSQLMKEEEFRIELEGENELVGCCRSRFFCY